MAEHIALLGDSIFDNASYTKGLPDVVTHLRRLLPNGVVASLFAVDGSTTADLADQLAQVPSNISRVVLSVGGNDALLNADILNLPVASTREALHIFGERASRFERGYRAALASVVTRVSGVTVCTIYNGNLPDEQAPSARVALMMFNDAILRVAFQLRLPVIDLRLVCSEPSDYANPIEPSGQGGAKIARAIASALGLLKGTPTSNVFAG
ncbi:MAG TPA: SGNH/GDSL hydrolase family protein [Polyangiaceae bacterium]|nr:SGNH/GDSL hydrolase family protein [Polyangiaceae bacterium]